MSEFPWRDKATLEDALDKLGSTHSVAEHWQCNQTTVFKWAKRFGLPLDACNQYSSRQYGKIDIEDIVEENQRIAQLRRERDQANHALKYLESNYLELQKVVDMFGRIDDADPHPPKWLKRKDGKDHRATLMLNLSDAHWDEVVEPEEVDGLNAYNRDIATLRLEEWAQRVVLLARRYLAGVKWDGFVLMLGGDMFSGNIHEELEQTNEDTLFGSVLYWSELLCAAVDILADEFGKGYIVSVPGNHPRLSRKPRSKHRAKDNLDWLLAHMVARQFKSDSRLTFNIPESLDVFFEVYGRGHLLQHGDVVRGGHGIGGIWPPIKRLRARLAEHHNVTSKPFETLWLGHWHQLTPTPGLVINGTLKGWDEYAKSQGFPFERPQQALCVATPEHGMTWTAPVFCHSKKEKW